MARTDTDDHHAAVPTWPVRKLAPPMSAPVIASTQKIALTDFRPSLVQYTSSRCSQSANSLTVRPTPTPKTAAATLRAVPCGAADTRTMPVPMMINMPKT